MLTLNSRDAILDGHLYLRFYEYLDKYIWDTRDLPTIVKTRLMIGLPYR